jgi:hypothetical protein
VLDLERRRLVVFEQASWRNRRDHGDNAPMLAHLGGLRHAGCWKSHV